MRQDLPVKRIAYFVVKLIFPHHIQGAEGSFDGLKIDLAVKSGGDF